MPHAATNIRASARGATQCGFGMVGQNSGYVGLGSKILSTHRDKLCRGIDNKR
jgi:hypothetical protein